MIDRKKLLEVSGLNTEKIKKMDEGQYLMYTRALLSFTDGYPAQEKSVQSSLENKDYDSFSKCLTVIWDTLMKINADELADRCLTQMKSLDNIKHEQLEAFAEGFLTALSTLSIDVQMAEYKDESGGGSSGGGAPKEEGGDGKNKILAVDDRAFFLNALKSLLQGSGYKLVCVNSGIAALSYLQKNSPDLFILDIEMPGMDGYELAGKIKAAGHKAPIIFLTGNAKKEYVVKAIHSGGSDFIVKPISKAQVLERIGKYIQPSFEKEEEAEIIFDDD